MQVTCGYGDKIYGLITVHGDEATFEGNEKVLRNFLTTMRQNKEQTLEAIAQTMPTRLHNILWAAVGDVRTQKKNNSVDFFQKFNPNHDSRTGQFATKLGGAAALDALSKKHPGTKFDFTGAEDVAVKNICEELDKNLSDYPDVAKTLTYVGTELKLPDDISVKGGAQGVRNLRQIIEQEPNTFALTSFYDDKSQAIVYNSRWTSDMDAWEATGKECQGRGWFREYNTDAATYMTAHEFGHTVMNVVTAETQGKDRWATFSRYTDGDIGEIRSTMSRWMLGHTQELDQVSGYGKTSYEEGWAEGYAQQKYAKRPSPYSNNQKELLGLLFNNGVLRKTDAVDISTIQDAAERKRAREEIQKIQEVIF